jgi:hypothetical protein
MSKLLALAAVLAMVPEMGWASPELECLELARDRTVLDENEQALLCRGAPSRAPVDCYRKASDDTPLSDDEAITLCRCADSTEPVACFQEASERLPAEQREAIRLCSAIGARKLSPDCQPVVPVAPRSGR